MLGTSGLFPSSAQSNQNLDCISHVVTLLLSVMNESGHQFSGIVDKLWQTFWWRSRPNESHHSPADVLTLVNKSVQVFLGSGGLFQRCSWWVMSVLLHPGLQLQAPVTLFFISSELLVSFWLSVFFLVMLSDYFWLIVKVLCGLFFWTVLFVLPALKLSVWEDRNLSATLLKFAFH